MGRRCRWARVDLIQVETTAIPEPNAADGSDQNGLELNGLELGDSERPGVHAGSFAAEHLSPSFPERAAWGTAGKLRAWQAEALDAYFVHEPRDFLAAATPGAGKTTFALRLATELLSRRVIERVTVVAPRHGGAHRGRADRAPEAAGGGGALGWVPPPRSRLKELGRTPLPPLPR